MTLTHRILAHCFETEGGCLEWRGATDGRGYGQIRVAGRTCRVHRVAYEIANGAIPEGLTIDHLCRNRACCNPDHLEAVTQSENVRRGLFPVISAARHRSQTHCKHGHELTPENAALRVYQGYVGRRCRECSRLRTATRRALEEVNAK